MKSCKTVFCAVMLTGLFALTACTSGLPGPPDDSTPSDPSSVASDSSSSAGTSEAAVTDSAKPSVMEVDNSATGISVIHQEYGDDIAEILQFSYDGQQPALEQSDWRNPELEMLNSMISAEPLKLYQDYCSGQLDDKSATSIDIRSYAFDKYDLLQIVTACVVFPETMPEQYSKVWSYNFSTTDNRWLQLDDTMEEYGLTAADIERNFLELYDLEPDAMILSVSTTGFLINRAPARPVTYFLLEVMMEDHSDPYKSFFMYTPDLEELEELDPLNMFSPELYDMAKFDPPLLYETSG